MWEASCHKGPFKGTVMDGVARLQEPETSLQHGQQAQKTPRPARHTKVNTLSCQEACAVSTHSEARTSAVKLWF